MTQVACANSFIALVCSPTDAQPPFSRFNSYHLGEVQPNLTAKEITAALDVVAKELQKRKQSVTIVAVGGAINTVLLSKLGCDNIHPALTLCRNPRVNGGCRFFRRR